MHLLFALSKVGGLERGQDILSVFIFGGSGGETSGNGNAMAYLGNETSEAFKLRLEPRAS